MSRMKRVIKGGNLIFFADNDRNNNINLFGAFGKCLTFGDSQEEIKEEDDKGLIVTRFLERLQENDFKGMKISLTMFSYDL